MIELLRKALTDARLVAPNAALHFNAYFGRAFVVHVFEQGRFLFAAKLFEGAQVEAEFRATESAFAVFGSLLPQPLAFDRISGIEIGIWRGVSHRPLGSWSGRQADAVVDGLARYFSLGLEHLVIGSTESHRNRLARVLCEARTGAPRLRTVADGVVLDAPALLRLPHVRQHGDFWCGNLGISGNRLVVFDWEDFGAITLWGHDLGVFVASALGFDPDAVARLEARGEPAFLDRIIADFCRKSGIDRKAFFSLLPAFLLEFVGLKIKGGYAVSIVNAAADLLAALGGERPAGAIRS